MHSLNNSATNASDNEQQQEEIINTDPISIASIKEAFLKRFKPLIKQGVKLTDLKHGETESVDEYIHRALSLNSEKSVSEDFLVSITEKGFRKNLAHIIIPHRPQTMEQLREIAAVSEVTVSVTAQPNSPTDLTATINNAVRSAVQSCEANQANLLNALLSKMETTLSAVNRPEQHRVRFSDRQQNSQNYKECKYCGVRSCTIRSYCLASNKTCHFCKKLGHFKKASLKLKRAQGSQSDYGREPVRHKDKQSGVINLIAKMDADKSTTHVSVADKNVRLRANKKIAKVEQVNTELIQNLDESSPSVSSVNTRSKVSDSDLEFDLSQSDLTEPEKAKLKLFLKENRTSFATNLAKLDKTEVYKHKIVIVPGARPVKQHFYRQSLQVKREMENQIQDLLKHNIIEKSNSDWLSPVVMIPKKNTGTWRLAIDYRKVNKVTVPMNFPLPQIESVFDTLGEAKPLILQILILRISFGKFHMMKIQNIKVHLSHNLVFMNEIA
ncbi:unnamed protein product [Mytilus coruscus]|uniref:Reverse transcriptase domain-containing protein n=1 Tax=Mytilus coruscus TaxID=42192 RepID=A0A6J8BA78_MYTCO|nr:unnamed protein product [Mytilus coruscus]